MQLLFNGVEYLLLVCCTHIGRPNTVRSRVSINYKAKRSFKLMLTRKRHSIESAPE